MANQLNALDILLLCVQSLDDKRVTLDTFVPRIAVISAILSTDRNPTAFIKAPYTDPK
jgi:hypothetical protein